MLSDFSSGEVTSSLGRPHSLRQRLSVLAVFVFLTASFQYKLSCRNGSMNESVTVDRNRGTPV